MKKVSFNLSSAVVLAFLIGAAAAIGVMEYVYLSAPKIVEVKDAANLRPEFTSAATPGWYTGSYYPSSNTVKSFGTYSNDDSCAVHINHEAGKLDIAAKLRHQKKMSKQIGSTMTPISTKTLSMSVGEKTKRYVLHQYKASKTSSLPGMYEGQAFGYIPVSDGYISISADCKKPDQLKSTIPALKNIAFKPNNAVKTPSDKAAGQ